MRRVFDDLLLALQRAMVLLGIVTLVITISTFTFEYRFFSAVPPISSGGDTYRPMLYHRLTVGLSTGLCPVGLGAVLFYLRRLYLAR